MLATPADIIGVPFLRMSLGDSTGRKFFQDDFRSMSIDELLGKRPRSAHVTFSAPSEERSMCWKYPSPRSVTLVAHAALLSLESSGRSRGELKCECQLSAWDWLTESYVPVANFVIDVHTPNSTVLEVTAVAREWKLNWTPRDAHAGIPSAFELGQLVRVDSAYDVANELLVNVTLPELQLRLIDSCQSEQLMLLKLQQFKLVSSFWLDPGYHAPNRKALSFATHRIQCESLAAELIQYRNLLRCPLLQPLAFEARLALNPHPFRPGPETPSLEWGGWAMSASMGATHLTVGNTALRVLKHFAECTKLHQASAHPTGTPFTCTYYRIRNHTGIDLHLGQVGTPESRSLPSSHEMNYSWYSLAPSLTFPLATPPPMPHPFFCPEPHLGDPQIGESLHHWLRISADRLSGWSQPFVIDLLPTQPSRTIADLKKKFSTGIRSDWVRPVRVYRTQPSASPKDDSIPPFLSLVALVYVQVERLNQFTVVTFRASHTLVNLLPDRVSWSMSQGPQPQMALPNTKSFRQVEYHDAVSADRVPEPNDVHTLDPGASTLLQVWFLRPLPSPKPLLPTIELLRVFASPQTMNEWLQVFDISLDLAYVSPVPRHTFCAWPKFFAWCSMVSPDPVGPTLIELRPAVLFNNAIPLPLSIPCHLEEKGGAEFVVPPDSSKACTDLDPREATELSFSMAETMSFSSPFDVSNLEFPQQLALVSTAGAQTAELAISETGSPTVSVNICSRFVISNFCRRDVCISVEPGSHSAEAVPRACGATTRSMVPSWSQNTPLFWPTQTLHRFWIGFQGHHTDTIFWSQTFVLKEGVLTYGPVLPKGKATGGATPAQNDQEFDVLTIDDWGQTLLQLVLSVDQTNAGTHIKLQPRFWIHNRCKNSISTQVCVKAPESPIATLEPGQGMPFEGFNILGHPHYDAKAPKSFRPVLRAKMDDWNWTTNFTLSDDMPRFLRMRHESLGFERLQACSVLVARNVRHLVFVDKQPPCILINSTSAELCYCTQLGGAGLQGSVHAGLSTEVEIEAEATRGLEAKTESEKRPDVSSLYIRLASSSVWSAAIPFVPGKRKLTLSADNAMILMDLDISYWRGSLVVLVQRLSGGVPVPFPQASPMVKIEASNFQLALRASEFSISFIDEEKAASCVRDSVAAGSTVPPAKRSRELWPNGQEFMRLAARELLFQVSSGPKPMPQSPVWDASCLGVLVQVKHVQLDNQLPFEEFPVVAACDTKDSQQPVEFEIQWRLPSELFFRNPHFPAFDSNDLDFVRISIPPIALNVEDSFMFRAVDLTLAFAGSLGLLRETASTRLEVPHGSHDVVVEGEQAVAECKHNATYSGPVVDDHILSLLGVNAAIKNVETLELSFHQLLISEILFRVTMHSSLAASVFLGVERMPVHLSMVSLKSTCCSADKLVRDIAGGYLADVLVRTPVLLGSLSLLGNPTFLVESFGRGLQDLVNMPKDALSQGPSAFARAMVGGVVSLLQHVTHGTLTSVSGFSNGLARNVEQLSPEDRFSLQREMLRARPPDGLGRGLINGFSTLGQSVAGAVLGVLASPIEGAARGGAWGFVKGMSGGLIGVVTKPVTGMLDLVSQTSQGLAGSSRESKGRQRGENPRSVPISELGLWFSTLKFETIAQRYAESYVGHLLCCDAVDSQQVFLLLLTDRGLRVFSADILFHFFPFGEFSISSSVIPCRVPLEILYVLRPRRAEANEDILGLFALEAGKTRLEFAVDPQQERAFLGKLRTQGKPR